MTSGGCALLDARLKCYDGRVVDLHDERMERDVAAGNLSTDRQISGLKPAVTAYERTISGSRGLAVRVFPSGSKQFEYRYVTTSGVRRRLVLGTYPGLTLAKARIAANAARMSVLGGADPVGERAAARERIRTGATLDELAEAYWSAAAVGLHGGRRRPKRPISIQRERHTWKRPNEKTSGVHARLDPAMGLAIQFLMLTLTRRTEIAGARKAEVDRAAGLWIIPSERAKARHPHVVPLGARCMEVLDKAWALDPDSPFLFPSPRSPDQHLDPQAITRAIARTCARKKLLLGSPHDVRRSGAKTLTGRYGVTRFIVGLVLGHTPSDGAAVTGVYDRHTYVPEKQRALELWAGHVCGEIAMYSVETGAIDAAEGLQAPEVSDEFAVYVSAAKSRALALCEAGNLHSAVLNLCMDLSRRPETASSHLEILGRGGARSRNFRLEGRRGGLGEGVPLITE